MSPLLRLAARTGSAAAVRARLAAGESPDAHDAQGMTALMVAAARGHWDAVEALIEAGADPSAAAAGEDAATLASAAGHLELAQFIRSRCHREETGPSETSVREARERPSAFPLHHAQPAAVVELIADGATHQSDDESWEADEPVSTPRDNVELRTQAGAVQALIEGHEIVDRDPDWGDVEVDLPAAAPLQQHRLDDPAMGLLAGIATIALKRGCIARDDVLEALSGICSNLGDHERALLAHLVRALEDSGVLVEDEQFSSLRGLPDPFEQAGETSDEEAEILARWVAEAVAGHDDPLWHWVRIAQAGKRLLTHDEEIRLGTQLQRAILDGLTALTSTALGRRVLVSFPGRTGPGLPTEQSEDQGDGAPVSGETTLGSWDDPREREDELGDESPLDIGTRLADLEEGTGEPDPALLRAIARWLPRSRLGIASLSAMTDQLRSLDPANASLGSLEEHWRKARAARDELVNRNLRLVMAVARRLPVQGMSLTDMLQDGSMGLMRAAAGFEPERGFRFSTYATWWVKQAVLRGMHDRSRLIRIPVHVCEKARTLETAEAGLVARLDRPPTLEELSAAVGLPERSVRRIRAARDQVLWIDDPVNAGWEELVDPSTEGVADAETDCDRAMMARRVRSEVDALKKKDAQIIRMRYGIGTAHEHTLEETGTAFEVTRERIRQIEAKAMRVLPKRLADLSASASSLHTRVCHEPTAGEVAECAVRADTALPAPATPEIIAPPTKGSADTPSTPGPAPEKEEHPELRKLRIALRLLASARRQRNVASWSDIQVPQKEFAMRWFQAYSTVDSEGLYTARQHGCFQQLSAALRSALRVTGFGPIGIEQLLAEPGWQHVLATAGTALRALDHDVGAFSGDIEEVAG